MRAKRQRRALFAVFASLIFTAAADAATLTPAQFAALAQRCAPTVHPTTIAAICAQESGLDPYVIGVNATQHRTIREGSIDAATSAARALLHSGASIDLGLCQINSANLSLTGLTPGTAFDPCRNIAAAATLLTDAYKRYLAAGYPPRKALVAAVSAYNTGSPTRGIKNGYVAMVRSHARPHYVVPSILPNDTAAPAAPQAPAPPAARPPSWDVFANAPQQAPVAGEPTWNVAVPASSQSAPPSAQASGPTGSPDPPLKTNAATDPDYSVRYVGNVAVLTATDSKD